ncbi:MAG TPA: phosphoribosylformylglycinamidine synthase I [Flavobacteriales bacterium]|nr:phosphoribosylformylglycinamidine synthase I [Flavobacteriales bacterium]|tara:strand:- start:7891 stop:8583 length:693 start_codon:yes stop_codon:yes gene_type:complete
MKFGVVTFPGSNCDMDMVNALEHDLGFSVEKLWHKDRNLQKADVIVLPGGFSYGDYLRSGAIARFSPIMDSVAEHAKKGGRVFGVCNGFQILCETGLLPGALLHNVSRKFICKNVNLKPVSRTAPVCSALDASSPITVPIAHGEGNYFIDDNGLRDLQDNDQILFQYCDEKGAVNAWSNPNGAIANIAGVANKELNVFGMMPHPERATSKDLGNTDGKGILAGLAALVTA